MHNVVMSNSAAVMINGALVSDVPPSVVLDDGLVRGDGVFEGMRQYGRRVRTVDAHLGRLERSATTIMLPFDRQLLAGELAEFSRATAEPDCAIRLMLTRGGQRIFREEPLPAPAASWRLHPVEHRVTPLLTASKTLSYAANMQANRLAKQAGCDEALFIRADDRAVLEAPTSSFCWIEGDTVVFPPLELGVLDSLTRRLVVEACETRTRTMPVDELAGADGALLVSTVMEARPIREVAGVATFDPESPAVQRLVTALAEITRARLEP